MPSLVGRMKEIPDPTGGDPGVTKWPDSRNQDAWGEGSHAEGQAVLAAGASCLVRYHFNSHLKWPGRHQASKWPMSPVFLV